MIKKGDRIKGFYFDKDNSARVGWEEAMSKYIGVEGTVHKIAEGPDGVGSRIEIRFSRKWNGDVFAMYPLAELLQEIRSERLKELGI